MHQPHATIQNSDICQDDNIKEVIMAMIGVNRLAYVKAMACDLFNVYAADGSLLAEFDSHQEAIDAIVGSNLMPARIH